MKIRIVSFNMHKGYSPLKMGYTIKEIRRLLEGITPDIVFLQELHGYHPEDYLGKPSPLEELSDQYWPHYRHGVNSAYSSNFHGNAILSRFPITHWSNADISVNPIEKRGLLHAQVEIASNICLDLFCTHLNLMPSGQRLQLDKIQNLILKNSKYPRRILAGDFNDWTNLFRRSLQGLGMMSLEPYKTFPSFFPILPLDKIFFQNLNLVHSAVSLDFRNCSDHLPIIADFELGQAK